MTHTTASAAPSPRRSSPPQRTVHGDDLLYRFFQEGLSKYPDLLQIVPKLLATTMGIWLPLEVYARLPILVPWVVRDPDCRGNQRTGALDQWASPDPRGYLRDDNSLIKGIPKSLAVQGPKDSHIRGARMGNEFVWP